MKPLLLLFLSLLLQLPAARPPAVRVTFSPLTKAAYETAKKAAVVTKPVLAFPVKKQKGRIVIPTAKGAKVFRDKGVGTDNDDQVEFKYVGYAADISCHLVTGNYWEGFLCHVVGDNGQQLKLSDTPVFSPDKRSFIVYSAGIEVSYLPNLIQLYRLKDGV